MIVRGRAATTATSVVYFQTNVPSQPEVALRVVVPYIRAGLITVPAELHFGVVESDTAQTREFDVYDDAPAPGTALAVGPPSDPRVRAEVLPPTADAGRVSYGTHLGRVRVTVGGVAGRVRGTLAVVAAGRPGADVAVPVSAEVEPAVVAVPDHLPAPGREAVRLLVRGRAAITGVTPSHVPDGLTVELPADTTARPVWTLAVRSVGQDESAAGRVIRLRVKLADGREHEVGVPVSPP